LIIAIKDIFCHLRIIGRLNEEQLKLLKKYKINYSNTFDLSATEMLEEYRKADIVTFVSTYEGFGMPIIEANAVGRVVITSNIAAMPEVANNAALMVNPLDTEAIRNGILKLINDDNYRNQLIQNGFENAKRFDVNVIAEQYLELYKEVENN
jgi:glycosyltransferase involved in cell wall biosynthesis